jgi:hypothetical protein
MIINYLLSILSIGISTLLTISFARAGPTTYPAYLDFHAMIITVVFPFIYQWALFGPSGLKIAFAAGFRKNVSLEELERSQLFFKSYTKIIWLSVLLPVVIGTVAMLKWVTPDDYTLMGPNFAMALMSFLYALVINAVIILPYSVILKRRMIELNID